MLLFGVPYVDIHILRYCDWLTVLRVSYLNKTYHHDIFTSEIWFNLILSSKVSIKLLRKFSNKEVFCFVNKHRLIESVPTLIECKTQWIHRYHKLGYILPIMMFGELGVIPTSDDLKLAAQNQHAELICSLVDYRFGINRLIMEVALGYKDDSILRYLYAHGIVPTVKEFSRFMYEFKWHASEQQSIFMFLLEIGFRPKTTYMSTLQQAIEGETWDSDRNLSVSLKEET